MRHPVLAASAAFVSFGCLALANEPASRQTLR